MTVFSRNENWGLRPDRLEVFHPKQRATHFLMKEETLINEHRKRDSDGQKARASPPHSSRLGKLLGCCKDCRGGWTTTQTWSSLNILRGLMNRNWDTLTSFWKINIVVFTHTKQRNIDYTTSAVFITEPLSLTSYNWGSWNWARDESKNKRAIFLAMTFLKQLLLCYHTKFIILDLCPWG